MKKLFLAVALVLSVGHCANAQSDGKDGLFTDWENLGNGLDEFDEFTDDPTRDPSLPGSHGGGGDTPAPLGSGIAVLTALGAGYALVRRKRDE